MTEELARELARKEYATLYYEINENEAEYIEANWHRFMARNYRIHRKYLGDCLGDMWTYIIEEKFLDEWHEVATADNRLFALRWIMDRDMPKRAAEIDYQYINMPETDIQAEIDAVVERDRLLDEARDVEWWRAYWKRASYFAKIKYFLTGRTS